MNEPRIRVLVAEDEVHLGTLLERFLAARGCEVVLHGDGASALAALRAESFDVALLDIVMPEMDGLEVLRQLREEASPPEVIIITGNGTIETAISAMKLGAYDYLAKPYRMAEIEVLVHRAWEKRQLSRENALLHSRLARLEAKEEIITSYAPMQAVLALVDRVARSDSPVLVTGESGTGKELVARRLHRLSHRSGGPLVDLNCAAIPDQMLESELFGFERGAFPGAHQRKLGLLELASGGTLFLDEIGELDLRLQGKLLRAIELGSFFRLGGTQQVQVDVRIIAASKDELTARVQRGTFRDDLLYRINTITITLPPLRERLVDIQPLASHFLHRFSGDTAPRLTDEAVEALQAYAWPGNVRELRNVMERTVLVHGEGPVRAVDLPLHGMTRPDAPPPPDPPVSLEEIERRHIDAVLRRFNWHQGRAAEVLGISAKTLYRKMREYGLRRPTEGRRHVDETEEGGVSGSGGAERA
jgi:two-component system, NtrC family, response regulator AtoC